MDRSRMKMVKCVFFMLFLLAAIASSRSLEAQSDVVAINGGSSQVGGYMADMDFSGTTATYTSTNGIDTSGVVNPAPAAVYQSVRYGNAAPFTYTIGGLAAGGAYTVRLHFAEIYYSQAGQRQFNVLINGTQVLTNFDIVATAGAPNKAVAESFSAAANGSGSIVIQFTQGNVDNPMVNGIEIQQAGNPSANYQVFAPGTLTLNPGENVVLNNFVLTMQDDGNLVGVLGGSNAVFVSHTWQGSNNFCSTGSNTCFTLYQGSDGHFMVIINNQVPFQNGYTPNPGCLVVENTSPYLAAIDSGGNVIWRSEGSANPQVGCNAGSGGVGGAPASVGVASGSGQSAAVGANFASPLVAVVKDANGAPAAGATVTFAGNNVNFPNGATAPTDSNGDASVMAAPTAAGALMVTASVAGVSGAASFSETGTSSAGLPNYQVFTPGSLTLNAGQQVTLNNFRLTLQLDGNFMAYPGNGYEVIANTWQGDNYCTGGNTCDVLYQNDGNLVVYVNGQWKWANGYGSACLVVENTPPYVAALNSSGGVVWASDSGTPQAGCSGAGSGGGSGGSAPAVQQPSGDSMGPLSVASGGFYFQTPSGQSVYLSGSHNWTTQQDRYTPTNFDQYLNFLTQSEHGNFMRDWMGENSQDYFSQYPAAWEVTPMPWARSGSCCANDGGYKFDLTQYDDASNGYFDRLRQRIIAAKGAGVYVSVMLFNGDSQISATVGGRPGDSYAWTNSVWNSQNNINQLDPPSGDANPPNGQSAQDGSYAPIVSLENEYVCHVVNAVGDLANVLYEISNEALGSDISGMQWQESMVNQVHYCEDHHSPNPFPHHMVGITSPDGYASPSQKDATNSWMLSSNADWVSLGGYDQYAYNYPQETGQKVVLLDTDHIYGEGGDQDWVWRQFMQGNNILYMDDLDATGVTGSVNSGNTPTEISARRGIDETRQAASYLPWTNVVPNPGLSDTGYCLSDGKNQYVVYAPNGGSFHVNLQGATGNVYVTWINVDADSTSPGGKIAPGGSSGYQLTSPFGGAAAAVVLSPAP